MLARLYPGVLVTLFACSIVDDSAITSQAELKKIELTGFTIDQQSSKGEKKISATLVSDSAVNITDASTGNKIDRLAIFKLPSLGSVKMKLRSGTTTDVDLSISYLNSTKPYTVALYQKDSVVEIYRFRYDAAGKLNRIVTIMNPVDSKPFLFSTNDSLIYTNSGEIEKIIRKSSDPAKAATITIEYPSNSGGWLSISSFTYQGFRYQQNGTNCSHNSGPNDCGIYSFGPQNGGGSGQSQVAYQVDELFDQVGRFQLTDNKMNNNGSCCREYDTYYFHPLMLLRNQLSKGDYLFLIYMMDWWAPGPVVNGNVNYTSNDRVTIDFSYGS